MFLILFCILWGALATLILSAPYSYYPLFIGITIFSILLFIFSKKFSKKITKPILISSIILFFISYSLCAYLVFRPHDSILIQPDKVSKNKTAVIFYCQGEMEKYTPYYSNVFFKDTPFILKPIKSIELKQFYQNLGVNTKNQSLLNTATEVKKSILNYKPYYFYIGFSDYSPDVRESIKCAVSDGCGKIILINYSSDTDFEARLNRENYIASLKSKGIKILCTKPVYDSPEVADVILSKIVNFPQKSDGILLIDRENSTSSKVKSELVSQGYSDSTIIISTDIKSSMQQFKNNNAKSILYVNLRESSSGIQSEVTYPKYFENYTDDFKITGIKCWGYDKRLVKACLNLLLEVEGK